MKQLALVTIGTVRKDGDGERVVLFPEYASALLGLEGFGHVNVLWWFSRNDMSACETWVETTPYQGGLAQLGVFATRSPLRPNPIALSCTAVTSIDPAHGVIGLAYIDAEDGTPVLDIKPYTPSLDRVNRPAVPAWCAHWPACCEDSGDFDWESVFTP